MTSLVTEATVKTIMGHTYEELTVYFGLTAIGLLIFMLILREVVRNGDVEKHEIWMRMLDVVTVPLLIVFGVILAIRGYVFIIEVGLPL